MGTGGGAKKPELSTLLLRYEKGLEQKSAYFEKTYGMAPSFRAGLHMGKVTTGEIGALKRNLLYR